MTNTVIPRVVVMTARWELFIDHVYPDKDGSLVIGYGHTNNLGTPPQVVPGKTVTEPEARDILHNDLDHVAKQVAIVTKGIELNDYQFGACVDVAFNRGIGRLRNSLPMYFMRHPEIKNHMAEAARAFVVRGIEINPDTGKEFSRLNYAIDQALGYEREYLGLTLRRIDNASLFQTKD